MEFISEFKRKKCRVLHLRIKLIKLQVERSQGLMNVIIDQNESSRRVGGSHPQHGTAHSTII